MSARIEPLSPPYEAEIASILERMMGHSGIEPLLLFRVVAHNKAILDKFRSTGSYLLNFGTVDPLEREIVILRTCARAGSEYEWGVHAVVYAPQVGLSEEQLRSTVLGSADDDVWSERQQVLMRFADELYSTATISDALWPVMNRWSAEQLVELVTIAGQYRLVSSITNAFRIPSEGSARRFPRDTGSGPG